MPVKVRDSLDNVYKLLSGIDIKDVYVDYEKDGKDVILSSELAALFYPDSTGRLRPLLDASGRMTEASAAAILAMNTIIKSNTEYNSFGFTSGAPPLFANPAFWNVAVGAGAHRRIMFVDVVTDAAGDSAVTTLVPLLAGYKACMCLQYIYPDGADPAWDFTISATSGLSGPNTMIALVSLANEIGPDWSPGIYFKATAVAEALTVVIANGGNIIHYWFAGVFWYEPA